METALCKCTNCETIMFDENENSDVNQHSVKNWKTILNEDVESMIKDNDGYWSCPKCETDDFLIDL